MGAPEAFSPTPCLRRQRTANTSPNPVAHPSILGVRRGSEEPVEIEQAAASRRTAKAPASQAGRDTCRAKTYTQQQRAGDRAYKTGADYYGVDGYGAGWTWSSGFQSPLKAEAGLKFGSSLRTNSLFPLVHACP